MIAPVQQTWDVRKHAEEDLALTHRDAHLDTKLGMVTFNWHYLLAVILTNSPIMVFSMALICDSFVPFANETLRICSDVILDFCDFLLAQRVFHASGSTSGGLDWPASIILLKLCRRLINAFVTYLWKPCLVDLCVVTFNLPLCNKKETTI